MNKSQYKRLFLILFIPLVGFGWWCAENDIFFEGKFLIECGNDYQTKDGFSCYSRQMSAKRLSDYKFESGGVYIYNSTRFLGGYLSSDTRLSTGFHEKIVLLGMNEMGLRDGVLQVTGVVGAGEVKDINLESNVGQPKYYNGHLIDLPGRCTLSSSSRLVDAKDEFGISCTSGLGLEVHGLGVRGSFKFLDIITAQKYLNMFALSEEKHRENSKKEIIIFVFSLFLPLIIFIAVSGLFFLLMKLVSYVRYGSKAN